MRPAISSLHLSGILVFFACTGGDELPESELVAEPLPTIVVGSSPDPATAASARSASQRATLDRFGVFHDFRFSDRRAESGIDFAHRSTDDSGKDYKPNHYDHGNGVVAADVDGDGLADLYFVSQLGPNRLFRNLGSGRFTDITDDAGVGVADRLSASASFADLDNDGDPELFVTTVRGGNLLFENDGSGRFEDVTEVSGLAYTGHSSGALFFDYDRDGYLDLFLANTGRYTTEKLGPGGYYVGFGFLPNSMPDAFSGHLFPERTERSILYRNRGDGRFEDVSDLVGLVEPGWTGDAIPVDLNEDGFQDLYVFDMQGDDDYWENEGGRRFVRRSAEVFPRTPWGTMSGKFFDFDLDGRLDLLLTDMHSDMSQEVPPRLEKMKSDMLWPDDFLQGGEDNIFGNAFYSQTADGRFLEISDSVGAESFWPWGFSVADLNSDGFQDVFITAGMNFPFRYHPNTVLLNNGGETFLDSEYILGIEPRSELREYQPWFTMDCGGRDRNHPRCRGQSGSFEILGAMGSRSSVIFDIDGDGDQDIVTNEFNGEPMVLVNDLADRRPVRFLQVRLRGRQSNRDALGAKVTVIAEDRTYVQINDGVSGYLSHSLLPLYFGLGEATRITRVEIEWPSGLSQVITDGLAVGRTLDVTEPGG